MWMGCTRMFFNCEGLWGVGMIKRITSLTRGECEINDLHIFTHLHFNEGLFLKLVVIRALSNKHQHHQRSTLATWGSLISTSAFYMQASFQYLLGSSCHGNWLELSWLHDGADFCILCPQCICWGAMNAVRSLFFFFFCNSLFSLFVIAAMKRVKVSS